MTSAMAPAPLEQREIEETTAWLAALQLPSGEIPWQRDGKSDPWDHVHAAMGLAAMGLHAEARAAYRFMAATQHPSGGWPCERVDGCPTRATQESNHAAYVATGLWHYYRATGDVAFLQELWPCVQRAIDWVVSLQLPSGAIAWASKKGKVWRAPLLTGSSSVHGSLVCAILIAQRLGHDSSRWREARVALAHALRHGMRTFYETDLPEGPGRHTMDWYYPVLGGALRGELGSERLLDPSSAEIYMTEGVGARCVRGQPWYTIAETCELVLALDSLGLRERAREVLSWTRWLRTEDGGYWTGSTHPDGVVFPEGEKTAWTAASVLIAFDAVHRTSATSHFFHELDASGIEARTRVHRPGSDRRDYDPAGVTPAE